MIPREAENLLRQLARGFPLVGITGPRQSGKTTLARYVFADKPYVSLEDPDVRERAEQDPKGFLKSYEEGAVFDEAQRCPDLFSYLQGIVDQDPRSGRFVLTGSQQFGLMSKITQSLAGRIGMVHLLPFTYQECYRDRKESPSLDEVLFTGLYPPVYDRLLPPPLWYGNYVQTYVERDVRQMLDVRDLSSFQRFIRLCAGRTGQLLNLSALAADCGITHNTARAWLSILEASYLVFLLPPHHRNFNKRLVKTPKLYFYDTGLASWLLGIRELAHLATHPMRGPLFETFVISEVAKQHFNRGFPQELYFWRDRTGHEVDLLIPRGERVQPVEIKSGQTLNADYFRGLRKWLEWTGNAAVDPALVYGGEEMLIHTGVRVLPWREVHRIEE